MSLQGLLAHDLETINWGDHSKHSDDGMICVRAFKKYFELPWTSNWRALQAAVVAAGIPRCDTPIPMVLANSSGLEPQQLDLAWAQMVDRSFRSTLLNPPHGRADLAIKFAKHLKAFDALHDIPAIMATGLLPPRIGPIRGKAAA